MVKVTFISFSGEEQTVDVEPGLSLMEGAVGNNIDGIEAVCGGNCYCATCRVYIEPDWQEKIGGPGEFEAPLLEESGDTHSNVRCSCQIEVTDDLDGLTVRLPESQT